jgi:hypothetical protein
MLSFGLLVGGLLFVIGLATYVFAPRVGPNPIFGVRVGYSYASREVWDKTNRLGGLLIALTGVGLTVLALLLYGLDISAGAGIGILTAVLLIALLAEVVWMFAYARRLAQGTAISREIAPVRFRWTYVAPVVGTFVLLVALAAFYYPILPVGRVASHFDLAGRPDGWMPRGEFLLTFLGVALGLVAFNLLIVFVATREPLIAFGRWGSGWRLEPEGGLMYLSLALGLVNVLLALVLLDVVWFNIHAIHLFPVSVVVGMVVLLVGILIGLFFIFAKKEPAGRGE